MNVNELKPIAGTEHYGLSPSGHVYNTKTGRRLKRRWTGTRFATTILLPNGEPRILYHDTVTLSGNHACRLPEDLRPIPDYPNYAVSPYGAIWRIAGEREFKPHIVAEYDRNGVSYVQLRNKFGKRHNKRVKLLVNLVWPES